MPTLELADGALLAYGETGSGPPLVLMHGSPGMGRSWARVVPHLSARYRVLTPDLPGYGGSTAVSHDPAVRTAAMGAAIGALVASLGEPVHLCGHSYGGNVAVHAAVTNGARLARLVLLEPVFFRALQLAGDEGTLGPAAEFFADYADRVTGGEPAAVHRMVDFWFGSGAYAAMPAPVQAFLAAQAPQNGVDVRAAFAEQVSAAALRSLSMPVVVGLGEASPPVTGAIARALVSCVPHATLAGIRGANHGMLDGHPDAVADLIAGTAT